MNKETLYHYTASGLDYVYLANGFNVKQTRHGEVVSIDRADDLHAAIARDIITSPTELRGQEVRFLRSILDLSQKGLGQVLGVTRDAVAKWEADPTRPIGQADRALRLFYALKADGHKVATQICELLAEIDEVENGGRRAVFEEAAFGWKIAA